MAIKTIKRKMLIFLLAMILAAAGIFGALIWFNNNLTTQYASRLGSLYMSEMMYQTQDHFSSIVAMKNQEAAHIAQHARDSFSPDPRQALVESAGEFGFDYLAFYDDSGNYETVMGQSAWYRDLNAFISGIREGSAGATTGYLTRSGDKYLVFGVPGRFEMAGGRESTVLLLGFSVQKLYDYIHIEHLEDLGSDIRLDVIQTNGAYVLQQNAGGSTSYFQHILQYGSFMGMETQAGVAQIEEAMAGGESFSHTVTLNGNTKHIYGAPVGSPENWYFVLSMPQGATDALLSEQTLVMLGNFALAALGIFLLFLAVFLFYMRLSLRQLKETEDARNEAEIANNAKSSFLSNMSHDIRTPMNAIAGFAVIAEDCIRQGKPQEALNAVSKVTRSSEYLRSLIGDVLDMSKIESGKLTLMPEPVSLAETIEMVDTIAHVRAEIKNQRYTLSCHDILHDHLLCDQTRLNQVLINLIGNAVKFTPEGGQITMEVWQEPSEKGMDQVRTCFMVEDNGIGISKQFQEVIFDSFSREESRVRKIEGTGLGLAISKRLMDMMEGDIRVESQEGRGSRFYVTVDLPKAAPQARQAQARETEDGSDFRRVLLAEDNDLNYEIAQILLESHGFQVRRAVNGEEAVELYRSGPEQWDVILMDLRMPLMDGYQAAERIRGMEGPDGKRIPIFALSADVFEEDIRKCLDSGMDGHISKPINMTELLRKLRRSHDPG